MQDLSANEARSEQNEINLTPMLDVVFIMLIFFIVTANIERLSSEDPDAPVAVKPDKRSSNEVLVQVLYAVRAAGRHDIALAANQR